jgi:predicted O-methyltransferase YrrM
LIKIDRLRLMYINENLPGQMTKQELVCIAELAKALPKNSVIIELGSLFGKSSVHWAKNASDSVKVYCVDPWKRENWIKPLEQKFNTTFSIDTFWKNIGDSSNVIALQAYSPQDFLDWNIPVDIYFDDSVHTNPIFRENLYFWLERMKPGSIMCGHDYSPDFPDIVAEVNKLADKFSVTVEIVDKIWIIRLPEDYSSSIYLESIKKKTQTNFEIETYPTAIDSINSMMKPDELSLLYSLTKNYFSDRGEIVDLGPFLGSSTACFAEGILANKRNIRKSYKRIYSYDLFCYEKYAGFDWLLQHKNLPTGSFFMNYMNNVKKYIDLGLVNITPGDICKYSWNSNPIEILFIDASKSLNLNDHIVKNFFSSLLSGSIIVQQDYYFYGCPWLYLSMELLKPWVDYVGEAPSATAYFVVSKKIPKIMTKNPLFKMINTARAIHYFNQLLKQTQNYSYKEQILILKFCQYLSESDNKKLINELKDVLLDPNRVIQSNLWSQSYQWNYQKFFETKIDARQNNVLSKDSNTLITAEV